MPESNPNSNRTRGFTLAALLEPVYGADMAAKIAATTEKLRSQARQHDETAAEASTSLNTAVTAPPPVAGEEVPFDPLALSCDDFMQLGQRANQGDVDALNQLRQVLERRSEIWLALGDLGAQVERTLIQLATRNNVLLEESTLRHIAWLKDEIAGQACSPLERLAVQRVICAWLASQHADHLMAVRGGDPQLLRTLSRVQEVSEKRLREALRSLELARRLAAQQPVAGKAGTAARPPAER